MPKYIVVEAHLEIADTVHNPLKVGESAAERIAEVLEEKYKRENEADRQVKTLIVAYRNVARVK